MREGREGGESLGRQGGVDLGREKSCVFVYKSPSCPISRLPLTNNTGEVLTYNSMSFLPMFPGSFGFGLARKTTRIPWHVELWLSPINSEAQKSHSQVLSLPQAFSEAELGGRDKGDQAKA